MTSTAKRLVPLSGIAAVVLALVGFLIPGDTPDLDAPQRDVASFYAAHHSDLSVSGFLLAIACAFFLVFFAALRNFLRGFETGDGGTSTFSFAGGILVTVGLGIFAGLNVALGDVPDKLAPSALQTMNVLSEDLFPPFAIGVIVFLIATGIAVLLTGALTKWLGWMAIVGALFAVTPLFPVAMLALAVFTVIASIRMAMDAEVAPSEAAVHAT
jgi:hypothetical protein